MKIKHINYTKKLGNYKNIRITSYFLKVRINLSASLTTE